VLEFEDAVAVGDVVGAVRISELVQRVAREVAGYVIELGTEGRLVAMQAEEVTAKVADDHALLIRDYAVAPGLREAAAVRTVISEIPQEGLGEDAAIAGALGLPVAPDSLEASVHSRGYRVLRRIPSLPVSVVNRLVERFAALAAISRASEQQLDDVDGVGARRAHAIAEGLRRVREASKY
jgi:diadenylate cyclase